MRTCVYVCAWKVAKVPSVFVGCDVMWCILVFDLVDTCVWSCDAMMYEFVRVLHGDVCVRHVTCGNADEGRAE